MSFNSGGVNAVQVSSAGVLNFFINGINLASAAGKLNVGEQYYFAVVFTSGATNGKQIWLGSSPETAVMIASATQTYTMGTVTDIRIGMNYGTAGESVDGYVDRLVFSTAARTSFPTVSASNIAAIYDMETQPLLATSFKNYLVIDDSEVYDSRMRVNFKYAIQGFQIYSTDGNAPTLRSYCGARAGSFGARNAGRVTVGTPNYYINQATGNDSTGTRNDPSKPFKTIQAALSDGDVVANDVFEVEGNFIYHENLVSINQCKIRAKEGAAPRLKPYSGDADSGHISAGGPGTSLEIDGFILDGLGYPGAIFLDASSTNLIKNCTVLGYAKTIQGSNSDFVVTNSIIENAVIFGANATGLYFTNSVIGSKQKRSTFNFVTPSFKHKGLTVYNSEITLFCFGSAVWYDEIEFIDSEITSLYNTDKMHVKFSNCFLDNSSLEVATTIDASYTVYFTLINCFQRTIGTPGTHGIKIYKGPHSPAGYSAAKVNLKMVNCVALNNVANFLFEAISGVTTNAITGIVKNCSSANGTSGFKKTATNPVYVTCTITECVSGTDTTAFDGFTATKSFENISFISSASGAENVTLNADSLALLASEDGVSAGYDQCYLETSSAVVLNGIIFKGSKLQEGGIYTTGRVIAEYLTFNALYGIGIRALTQSWYIAVLANCAGHGVALLNYTDSIEQSIFYKCGGSGIINYGQVSDIRNVTACYCQNGIVSKDNLETIENVILSASGSFDYSGDSIPSYSCIGTLDPSKAGSLATTCTQLDPLFRDPANGDLRLQALEAQYYFDSPAKGTGTVGADIGAFDFTYGAESKAWTEVDFGNTGWRNPDQVMYKNIAVKPAEVEQENGAIFSTAATFKNEYEFTWDGSANDMPDAQREALLVMFNSFTNKIQIDRGLGDGWQDAYFARQQGFEYTDMSGLYSDTSVPKPLRSLVIREA